MSKYVIEDTYSGFRLTLLDSASNKPRMHYDEVGGHGPMEKLFADTDQLWLELRSTQVQGTFIIEHPTRGTFREFNEDMPHQPRFSWSGARNDPDKAYQFRSFDEAIEILNKLPASIKKDCVIRKAPDYEVVVI